MLLRIDEAADLPIYEQIMRQMKFLIASDVLTPGDLVPSVRELAKQAAINPTTVQRAYQRLQDEAVICRRRGRGLAVTPEAPDVCRTQRLEMIRRRVRQVLEEARASGLDDAELGELVQNELVKSKQEEAQS